MIIFPLWNDNRNCRWLFVIKEWEIQIWSRSSSAQPDITPLFTTSIQYLKKPTSFQNKSFPRRAKSGAQLCRYWHDAVVSNWAIKHFDFQKLAGLLLAGKVVNRVGIYGSQKAEGCSASQRRSWYRCKNRKYQDSLNYREMCLLCEPFDGIKLRGWWKTCFVTNTCHFAQNRHTKSTLRTTHDRIDI